MFQWGYNPMHYESGSLGNACYTTSYDVTGKKCYASEEAAESTRRFPPGHKLAYLTPEV